MGFKTILVHCDSGAGTATRLQLAAAATPPVVAYLMSAVGWQQALFWPGLPAVVVILVWSWYARNSPREHPSVTPEEIAELGKEATPPPPAKVDWRRLRHLLKQGHRTRHRCKLEKDGGIKKVHRHQQANCQ